MLHDVALDAELYVRLRDIDGEVTRRVQAAGCPRCGGRLDRADFPRKVRGAPAAAEPWLETRLGLCCSREGCRRRVLPPSVRFLGRKVYAAVVIVVHCIAEAASRRWQEVRRVARWLWWWRSEFARSATFAALRGHVLGGVDADRLPASLLEQVRGMSDADRLERFLMLVAGVAPPKAQQS